MDAVAVAFEEAGNAHPLGMVTTEAGMGPIDLLESVGKPSRRQLTGREPAAEIGKSSRDRRKGDADQGESCERASPAETRPRDSCTCFEVDRHVTLQSTTIAFLDASRISASLPG